MIAVHREPLAILDSDGKVNHAKAANKCSITSLNVERYGSMLLATLASSYRVLKNEWRCSTTLSLKTKRKLTSLTRILCTHRAKSRLM